MAGQKIPLIIQLFLAIQILIMINYGATPSLQCFHNPIIQLKLCLREMKRVEAFRLLHAFHYLDSLKLKIKHRLKSIDNDPLNSKCGEVLQLLYMHLESIEEAAKSTLYTDLNREITRHVFDLTWKLGAMDPNSEINQDVIQNGVILEEIVSFTPQLKMLVHKCSDGLYNTFPDNDEQVDDDVSSDMIGACEVYQQLKDKLLGSQRLIPLVGMPGIGKTTIAKKLFNDPEVVECFDHRVWIRLGKKYRRKDIPRRILEKIDPNGLQMLPEGNKEAVDEYLKESLKSKKYLIVLDNVWDCYVMDLFLSTNTRDQSFLHPECGSRILITSRLHQLDECRAPHDRKDMNITMRLLSKKESWDLLRGRVFSQGSCPTQLEKAGKKFSENCEGLPLTIVTLARLLTLKEEKSDPEYWDEIAANKNHQIFLDVYEEISKVLLPSYTYLPPLLKMCFMSIGLFPPKYEVPRSKLINLWLADGFSELNVHISTVKSALECLGELVFNSIVMVYQVSSFNFDYKIKTCGLHSSLWHLSKKKARETKFALLLSTRSDGIEDGIEGHHRLYFNNNVLFAIKDVHKSVEDKCASAARSLFCFGPYHQYEVPLCFHLKFLKELDALSIRFYEFPMEILQLARLIYLSLTMCGMIPSSISQLQFLEFLIVDRHHNIKSCKDASYLPAEIWSLQKLKHLEVMGSNLPNPLGASLSFLSTLKNVSARSCTIDVLEGIPHLQELKIRIELTPDGEGKTLIIFGTQHISFLKRIHTLKCVIVNPGAITHVAPFSSFIEGRCLRKLSLSGMRYPWKEMKNIASLPCLGVLKLKHYAFQGSKWEVEENSFSYLTNLVIEDTDLVDWDWDHGSGTFGGIMSVTLKQCYKLEKIHGMFGVFLERIKLVDCNPSCVDEIKKAVRSKNTFEMNVHSSWEDE